MTMQEDLIKWMLVHKFAKNEYNATAMIALLELNDLPRFWVKCRRVIVYRQWRRAGENPKMAKHYALNDILVRDKYKDMF